MFPFDPKVKHVRNAVEYYPHIADGAGYAVIFDYGIADPKKYFYVAMRQDGNVLTLARIGKFENTSKLAFSALEE